LVVLIIAGLFIEYWQYMIPATALLVVLVAVLLSSKAAERRQREQELRRREYETWLAGPPPPFVPPRRFTQTWIASNAPKLHPGQVPVFLAELRSRGWSAADIDYRVRPHLPS
jgi:hypothetical protein